MASQRHDLPESCNTIGVKLCVTTQDRQAFRQGLADQQAVERIAVMKRQSHDAGAVGGPDGQKKHPVVSKFSLQALDPATETKFAQAGLDGDLPEGHHTDEHRDGTVFQSFSRSYAEAGRAAKPPEIGVRVQQIAQAIYSAKSSSGASKSSAMEMIRPGRRPAWRFGSADS